MQRQVRPAEGLLGIEGLALLRHQWTADDDTVHARLDEARWILDRFDAGPDGDPYEASQFDIETGYTIWSETYDDDGNPLLPLEEAVVCALLARCPSGRALDAACGTGRHARYLTELGHTVVGVDASPAMLARARANVPGADFRPGDLLNLPIDTASVDLAVCALALTHFVDLHAPLAELARVLRPGGRLIVTDFHPFFVSLGGHARFRTPNGERAFIINHVHLHGEYLAAFRSAALTVLGCHEPLVTEAAAGIAGRLSLELIPDAAQAAVVGLPGALIWELERPLG
jgi:ubiquinone/menaquinone biosynthesis C-methylase UbiE